MALNIKWKGKFETEDELTQGSSLPDNAVMFREGDTIQDAFSKGLLLMLPIMIVVIGLSIYRCRQLEMKIEMNVETGVAFLIMLVILQCLTYVHEFIHAVFYPANEEKTIWSYRKQGAYFIYCNAIISKQRFIIMSIAPMIILGVIPFILWLIIAEYINMPYNLVFLFISWMMIFMSLGDLTNVYHAVRQVPKNGKVLNYGMHSFWLQ